MAAKHWVLSFDELREAGLTARQIEERDGTLLHRLHRGVYAVGRPDVSFLGACRAATLACGEGSAVSHITAAGVHRIRQSAGRIHVSGPRSLRGHPGLYVHRPRSLPLIDIVEVEGVAVTSVARTLLDLAATASVDDLGRWIHQAVVERNFDQRETWAVCQRHPHHRGRPRLAAALALEVVPVRSGLERAFLAAVRAAGLPAPAVNATYWTGQAWEEVDFSWPAAGLIVEVDGERYHATRWRRRRDSAKDARFRAIGWRVERVPELALTLDPAGVTAGLGLP